MESFCLFKVGFKSLMNSTSNIRQSHLVLHFLKNAEKSRKACDDGHSLFVHSYDPLSSIRLS